MTDLQQSSTLPLSSLKMLMRLVLNPRSAAFTHLQDIASINFDQESASRRVKYFSVNGYPTKTQEFLHNKVVVFNVVYSLSNGNNTRIRLV